MPRRKLRKLNEVVHFPNVFDFENEPTETDLRTYYNNDNPITLEIGCGEGDYTLSLARMYPGRNFLGIDFKGARIHTGARTALEEKINNAAYLWTNAEKLPEFFQKEKIDEIFVTFPEPHVKRRAERRRLICPRFLDIYRKIIKPGAHIHLKTDDLFLFNYAMEVVEKNPVKLIFSSDNLYKEDTLDEIKRITTRYERFYLNEGRTIKYIEFQLLP